jgi:hypothetical protein
MNLHSLVDDSGFLQKVFRNLCSYYSSRSGKFHFQIFSKSAGIVIYSSACIAKGFDQIVHL